MVEVPHEAGSIADAIRDQVAHGPYERSLLFGDGTAGRRIADVLATASPRVQKQLQLDALPDTASRRGEQ